MGSIINPYTIIVQIIFFLVGLLMFFDAVFIYHKNRHPATTFCVAVLGGAISIIMTFTGNAATYLVLVFLITAIIYIYVSLVRRGVIKRKGWEDHSM